MSGPPVPQQQPGSNSIGKFIIGVSPIGDIPAFSFWDTIISQYANSPIITTLIENWFDCLDQTVNLELFYDNIMSIDTAFGYGLDLWGRILGITRVLNIPSTGTYFGFSAAAPTVQGFSQAPFYSGTQLNNNFSLSDPSYKQLLIAKALANITNGTIPALNKILLTLFPGRGNAYVTDNGNMTMTYTFNFFLTPVEQSIVLSSGVLPKPVGVSLSIIQL